MNTVSKIPDEFIHRLLDGAFTREEKAAIHVITHLDSVIFRTDFIEAFVRDLEDGEDELVIDWRLLAEEEPPLSSGEQVMIQLALALVGVRPMRLDDLQYVDTRNVEVALDAITYVATGRWTR